LESGGVTLPVLDRRIDGYIASRKRGAKVAAR